MSFDSFSPSLERLYDRLAGRLRKFPLFAVVGNMKDDSKIVIAVMGVKETAYQLAKTLCLQSERVYPIGRAFCQQVYTSRCLGAQLAALCFPRQYLHNLEEKDYFALPEVTFSLDLRESSSKIMSKMSRRRRRDIRKLATLDYSYFVSRRNRQAFEFFYWKMYVPYAQERFKDAAYVEPYLKLRSMYNRNGGVLFVRGGKKTVSGILFKIKNRTVSALNLGINLGDPDLVRELVGQKALESLIEWGKSQQFERLDYGSALPFLKDGVFVYKKEWGMRIEKTTDNCFCVLRIDPSEQSCLSFLKQNPFIFLHKGEMKAFILVDHHVEKTELSRIASEYLVPGLGSLMVMSYDKLTPHKTSDFEGLITTDANHDWPKPVYVLTDKLKKNGFSITIVELR